MRARSTNVSTPEISMSRSHWELVRRASSVVPPVVLS